SSVSLKIYYTLFTLIHFTAAIAHIYLNDTIGKDAFRYFNNALEAENWFQLFDVGRNFMSFLVYPFVKLGITIHVLFLLFATISFKGFLLYFEMLDIKKITKNNWFLLVLFLMPSLHFWTGFLGKEALLLLITVYLLKIISTISFGIPFFIAFLLLFFIRPHMFFILSFVFILVLYLEKGILKKIKRNLILILLISTVILVPVFFKYFLKIEVFNIVVIKEYLSAFLSYTQVNTGNSPISLADTTLFSRILMQLFMPLPYLYAIKNVFQLGIAIENSYFLLICIYSIYYFIKNGIKINNISIDLKFALISSILLIILIGSYIYNLGLASRMRVMFLPYLFYFLIHTINTNRAH
ncbi:MAG: hypothetical protein COC22_03955, partial [Flavobacteriaceae bacterium]